MLCLLLLGNSTARRNTYADLSDDSEVATAHMTASQMATAQFRPPRCGFSAPSKQKRYYFDLPSGTGKPEDDKAVVFLRDPQNPKIIVYNHAHWRISAKTKDGQLTGAPQWSPVDSSSRIGQQMVQIDVYKQVEYVRRSVQDGLIKFEMEQNACSVPVRPSRSLLQVDEAEARYNSSSIRPNGRVKRSRRSREGARATKNPRPRKPGPPSRGPPSRGPAAIPKAPSFSPPPVEKICGLNFAGGTFYPRAVVMAALKQVAKQWADREQITMKGADSLEVELEPSRAGQLIFGGSLIGALAPLPAIYFSAELGQLIGMPVAATTIALSTYFGWKAYNDLKRHQNVSAAEKLYEKVHCLSRVQCPGAITCMEVCSDDDPANHVVVPRSRVEYTSKFACT